MKPHYGSYYETFEWDSHLEWDPHLEWNSCLQTLRLCRQKLSENQTVAEVQRKSAFGLSGTLSNLDQLVWVILDRKEPFEAQMIRLMSWAISWNSKLRFQKVSKQIGSFDFDFASEFRIYWKLRKFKRRFWRPKISSRLFQVFEVWISCVQGKFRGDSRSPESLDKFFQSFQTFKSVQNWLQGLRCR